MNSEFSFSKTGCHTKVKDPCLPYYLPITGGRSVGFVPFSTVVALWEIQTALSKIWIQVDMSISYNFKHYTSTSNIYILYIYICKTLKMHRGSTIQSKMWTTIQTEDLLIVAKDCIEWAILFRWAGNRRMVHKCTTKFLNHIPQALNSESFFLLDWLP